MPAARIAILTLAVLAFASSAQAGYGPAPAKATALRPFLLTPAEPAVHSFPRTPSFAWRPVRNAASYEFELATSRKFNEGTIVWSSNTLKTPALSIPVALPWMTGNPYALYAHVRAISPRGAAGPWSDAYPLNVQWANRPTKMPGDEHPGLIRWTPVDGASAYDIWWTDIGKVIRTRTNVADERELYTFHQGEAWTETIHWRVRAVRKTYGSLPNGIPTVSYGPWSALQTSRNPGFAEGEMQLDSTVANKVSTSERAAAHGLTPGFVFAGNQALYGKAAELYRVYVFSDADCVNVVFKGAIVGSPAYAPRMTGPLALPGDTTTLKAARGGILLDGSEGTTAMADGAKVMTTESDKTPVVTQSDTQNSETSTAPPSEGGLTLPGVPKETGAPVDLWDSGWPNGRYYWTVVPVEAYWFGDTLTYLSGGAGEGSTTITVKGAAGLSADTKIDVGTGSAVDEVEIQSVAGDTLTLKTPLAHTHGPGEEVYTPGTKVRYQDLDEPQDACANGRVQAFGKVSEPSVTAAGAPYVTGLSPHGRLVQAAVSRPSFYGAPLVAWKPALGADEYEVQYSPTKYPWRPVDPVTKERYDKLTYATSALLDHTVNGPTGKVRAPLPAGTWWYRVRGIDFALPGTARAMSWSDPIPVVLTKPVFTVG